ncbi:MAG TPA: hypothetical protein DCP03_06790 [Polaromonas sp.]|nr:hypothetical protein [Polaromonas sp.]
MHINTDTPDTGATPSPEQRIVFIDCEFTDLADPKLLSIGLVADDGRELYVELTGDLHLASASAFVLDTVAPQFGLVPHQETSLIDIGKRVGDWLLAFGETSVSVCYDYHADMDLLEHTLRSVGLWTRLSPVLKPTHVGYLIGESDVEKAMDASWRASFAANGIDRHHALADARALRAGYVSMHGGGPSTHLGRFDGEGIAVTAEPRIEEMTPAQVAWFDGGGVTSLQRFNDAKAEDGLDAPDGTPVLFLDIDDVLCLSDPFGGFDAIDAIRSKHPRPELVFRHLFHLPAVDVLKSVHEKLECWVRYVITSTWRQHLTRSQFSEIMRRSGLGFVADNLERKGRWSTVVWPERTRLNEIAEWLQRHGKGEPFVVVDDTFSGQALATARQYADGPFHRRIVLCDENVGLLPEHVTLIVEALRRR